MLKLANDTEYGKIPKGNLNQFDAVGDIANLSFQGLMSGVFTKDITRALRVAKNLDTGVVGINCVSYVKTKL